MTAATEQYLREMSPTLLRRTIYDSMRILRNARKYPNDLRARQMLEANEVFVPVARRIAAERGISLRERI